MINKLITINECKKLISDFNPLISLFLGIIGGWFFTRGMSLLSGPNIEIKLGEDAYFSRNTSNEVKFLHVKVLNKKRSKIFRFLFGNASADNARAWITYIDPITKSEIFTINGRWTTTKEPVNYETNKPDIGSALIPSREVIPAGEDSTISIAIKTTNEISAYAFNNESYLYAWKKPDFELNSERYLIKIKIVAGGYEWIKMFTLLNLGKSTSKFKLSE